MITRRQMAAGLAAMAAAAAAPAWGAEFQPYDPAQVEKAIASGKPVVVHVYAPWCLQCHIQSMRLDGLKNDPAYSGISFFRVDYDNQKDVVEKLGCPRSTLIAYKGGKEVSRMSWGLSEASVVGVLKAAM
ncbi:thiol-disulfide isomerase/thioredoxin [Roseiarcus fermentans]|uniref:Thiol-disulfide isomerase/thioredoxin n=1 Tax=Roseiarcus fermentans TaxID=1473586 RepID=A0A366F5A5_9HYPH|nr:thioredoxin family protein [Roseiarcus fermentans]RBP09832.1 thiol-disulfide isomerase/thioredoxin [Roseiarcus fermentans]